MASIGDVLIRARQVFQRIPSDSFLSQGDDRLKYFTNNILPHILRLEQKHTMIFIPSYFDFTAVRNLLLKKEVSFVSITEYARTSEISRGRARFLQGRKDIMLYTGRSFFFMRHFIKGVKHLVFFGLPEHGEFYPNLVNMMSVDHLQGTQVDISIFSCLCLYTKYDAHALERIVGTKYCDTMINGEKGTFLFNS
jgi:U3 small nucleolar RNA-associated protein 25